MHLLDSFPSLFLSLLYTLLLYSHYNEPGIQNKVSRVDAAGDHYPKQEEAQSTITDSLVTDSKTRLISYIFIIKILESIIIQFPSKLLTKSIPKLRTIKTIKNITSSFIFRC